LFLWWYLFRLLNYILDLCGILQGSILGPILFLLYVKDLANISNKLKFILFADDTNVFYAGKSIAGVNNVLNNELKQLKRVNGLKLIN